MYKYEQIAKQLKQQIIDKKIKPGDLLPDQNQLAEKYDTTRITIRKAIQSLAVEGLVYSQRGAGTFVRKNAQMINDFSTEIDQPLGTTQTHPGRKVNSKFINLSARICNEDERSQLMLDEDDIVYVIDRTRFVDDQPFSNEHTIMPAKLAKITSEILAGSIYSYLQNEIGLKIGGSHRKVRAKKVNERDAKYLKEKIGDPVLAIEQVSYLSDGTPFEYSDSHFPYQNSFVTADINLLK